jgi:hypothetical protein
METRGARQIEKGPARLKETVGAATTTTTTATLPATNVPILTSEEYVLQWLANFGPLW